MGDSSFTSSGVPDWAIEDNPEAWQSIDYPATPPERGEQTNVWFKVTLPAADLRDPVIYISSIDLLVEAYLDGQRIYRHGQFDAEGKGDFAGWPWHMLVLPEDFAGKTLYLRVYSDYLTIGAWGEIKLSDRISVLTQVFEESSQGLVVAGICLLIAVMAAIFVLLGGQQREFLSVCLFSLASAGLIFGDIPAMQLLLDRPLLWNYIGAYAYFLLPIPMFLLLAEWLASIRFQAGLFSWLWKFHLLFLVVAGCSSVLGIAKLTQLYPLFDGIFTISLVLLLVAVFWVFHRVSIEQKVLILAYFGFCSVLMLDMAVAHDWLAWTSVPVSSGALVFSLAIIGVSLQHYLQTQRNLAELNLSLESRVNERTQQLEIMAEKERTRSEVLLFQQAKTELLNEISLDLEACHTLESGLQTICHWAPKLSEPFSGSFYLQHHNRWKQIATWGATSKQATLTDGQQPMVPVPGNFYLYVTNQQGEEKSVALLKVDVDDQGPAYLPVDNFVQILQRGLEKISITLANIALREELQRFSYEDALTGLKNRRFFAEVLEREIAAAKRNGGPLSLLICDIDYFKQFNDTHGHAAGDEALKVIANVLSNSFRQADVACRLGGEEFVVILPQANAVNSLSRAQQLLRDVENTQISALGMDLGHVTLSIGIASWPEGVASPNDLLN